MHVAVLKRSGHWRRRRKADIRERATQVIGGGMVFTFLKARGLATGSSLVEEDKIDLAKSLEKKAADKGG